MVSIHALASFAAFVAVTNAAPSLLPRAGTIGSQCTDVKISQGWLVGNCLTGSGDTRITSGTNLNNKITNDDGVLKWKEDGSYSRYCEGCKLLEGGSSLNCQCRPNFGQSKDTTLKLDEHIGVYNGHLLSDTKGTPPPPSSPSKYDFPSDFTYGFGGNGTCVDGSVRPDWCAGVAPGCTNGDRSDLKETPFQHITPINKCLAPAIYFEDKFQFSQLKLAGVGAWELTGYSDEACTKKVVTISSEDAGTCKTLPEQVRGVLSRPLFNGDSN
ncbi:Cyanovirin-N [Byssothecium circinans]|uniref:Cyanovirin-N n=1 Tax=Byssothecium circinans TaxID=147558 RepID=A0A6A5U2Y1_9PLEO|nr:Cyanovirin-N [Byssothecium circinans]